MTDFTFDVSVSCHAWNADRSQIAICPNDHTVRIYSRQGAEYSLLHTLKEHDSLVTGIDWAPKTNRIVTCSQDRNAYVWTLTNGKWMPTLVILRINRAATHCKWSPQETKFAVASGAKLVSVCYFEEDHDWWVSKHIKKHKSTVTNVDWHPSGAIIATASTDFKIRVISAVIRGVDARGASTAPFQQVPAFGEVMFEGSVQGWAHAVKWSPSGNVLAACAHDACLHFVDFAAGNAVQVVRTRKLPFRDLIFVGEGQVIAAGHDNKPTMYAKNGSNWAFAKEFDQKAAGAGPKGQGSAFNLFQNKVDRGESETETNLETKHQNCIGTIQLISNKEFSTTANDGAIKVWQL